MKNNKFLLLILFLAVCLKAFPEKQGPLDVVLFYSPSCKACLSIKQELLPKLKYTYKEAVRITYLNTREEENLKKLLAVSSRLGIERSTVPSVLCADNLLIGKGAITENLPGIIDEYLNSGVELLVPSGFDRSIIEDKFRSFSLFTLLAAGFLDGFNPCAFTVIVFFISFLTFYGYRKKELIAIGSSYVLAVFITYLLIGLGLFGFLYSFKHFYSLMKFFYMGVALLCFVLGFVSLYDYLKFSRTKRAEGSVLQLPRLIKRRIHRVIGDEFRERKSGRRFVSLFLGALGVGFSVSILEAVCTGQIYLPVIAFVLKDPELRLKAFIYLLAYNLMFILPLVGVFLFGLWGASSRAFSEFLNRRLNLIRLAMVVLFLGLGVLILFVS